MVNKMDKNAAWDYAIGMVKVDGLEPTPEMRDLIEKEKRGEITKEDIYHKLNQRYRMKTG
ncbi:MAG: antitoxin VbhA family protein [Clostridiales Family XIII bacterium]|jgi:hypothetical protein|nr:antitoxin VbhA family protein [Clostridiales Family XIII bacterium]